MIELKLGNQLVKIDKGELVSYTVAGFEYMHQKGSPGWRNSDTEMFPIIGPTAAANFTVSTPKGDAVQDQHGLLRELNYETVKASELVAVFQKNYIANTKVLNSKYPEKSSVKELYWPYSFQFQKIIELKKEGVEITFKISAEEGMPYMLGYHPAFKTENNAIEVQILEGENCTVKEIQDTGSNAYYIPEKSAVTLLNKKALKIEIKGFNQFMLWTEVDTMLCVEPITFYPPNVAQNELDKGYSYVGKDAEVYKVFLKPCLN